MAALPYDQPPDAPFAAHAARSLRVRRAGPLRGSAAVVGDKSLSHRALLLAALGEGATRVENLSPCRDVQRTLDALRALGVDVADERPGADRVTVRGAGVAGLGGPPVVLDCGDSGTTMRLLAGLLAGQRRAFELCGDPGLSARPMARVIEPLRALGADLRATDGHAPLHGAPAPGGLRGADVRLERASAQVGGAVLLAGLNADGPTTVRYPSPVRDHTERLLAGMGAPIRWDGAQTRLDGPVARLEPPFGGRYVVLRDPSAAAFLAVAAVLTPGSDVRLTGVCVNPGRTGLFDLLAAMGAPVALEDLAVLCGEPAATVRAAHGPLRGVRAGGALVPRAIDELPLLAVAATQAEGATVLADAAELRVKESDRIAAMVDGLSAMGAAIEARPDGFVVRGPTPLRGARVDGRGDHRVVMALAVAGLVADGETVVAGAERIADSFPGFAEALAALGGDVRVEAGGG